MKHVGSAARPRFCVLVTGFGAFPGARTNPTIDILRKLERCKARLGRLDIELRCAVIPVVYAQIADRLSALVADTRPDAVLHLGLAARRKALCVETRAVNRTHPLHPDASGRRPAHQTFAGGAPRLATTYPALPILAAIRRGGVEAALSIDTGDYVCNATLYRSLAAGIAPQIGFLHVPRPRISPQPLAGAWRSKPTVDDLTKATLAAVLVMARRASHLAAPAAPTAPSTNGAPGDR